MSTLTFLKWLSEFPIENASRRKQILKDIKAWKIDTNFLLKEEIFKATEKYLNSCETFSKSTAVLLTNLIEDVNGFKDAFCPLVGLIIAKIAMTLKSENKSEAEITAKCLRLALQILQSYKARITELLLQLDISLQNDFGVIGQTALVIATKDEKHLCDVSQMCGTILGFMCSYFENTQTTAESMYLLFDKSSETIKLKIMPTVTLSLNNVTLQPLSEIWVMMGILSCCKPEVMWNPINGAHDKLLQIVFNKITSSCKSTDPVLQYHAFRALKLLWTKILKLCKKFNEIHPKFKQDSIHLQKSLTLVWENWDNPVSGIPDLSNKIFEYILKVNANAEENSLLPELVYKHVSATSAFVKGKYGVLSTLIKAIGVESFLSKNDTFFDSLIPCLEKNHLAPVVSRVYQCCILEAKKSAQDGLTLWRKLFAPSLLQSLLHSSLTIQTNALHYWVQPNLKFHTEIYDELTSMLMASSQNSFQNDTFLFAMLGVIKCARCSGLRHFCTLEHDVLNVGITALNDKIRSTAWSVICISNKPSDSITDEEFAFVREHLPLNFNSDSASFRNELLFSVGSFIQRVVTNFAACVKKEPQSANIEKYVCFLRWINHLSISSLASTCSYQRKHTSISFLAFLLQTLDVSSANKRKKILPQDLQLVVKTLQKNDISFCTYDEAKLLIDLLEDGVPDLRECAFSLLLGYFPKSLLSSFTTKLEEKYKMLLNSPKAQDAESGSLIAVFLLNVLLLPEDKEINNSFTFMSFLQTHISPNLSKQFVHLKNNYLEASHCSPGFGWLLALSKCCNLFHSIISDNFKSHKDVFDSISKLLMEVISLLLYVMSKVFACTDENMEFVASADFQEMSAQIVKIINDCKQRDGKTVTMYKEHVMLANDEEIVLACSWLIMKNGCNALASMGLLLKSLTENENIHTFFPIWEKISDCFLKVLTSCRHRGIIESCAECLYTVCHNLFRSKSCALADLVVGLIDEILMLFSTNSSSKEIAGGTVTRRSAGLPLIVESVLSASVGTDASLNLVAKTVDTMAACISDLMSEAHVKPNDNADIPAVHGLFVLKHLFKNTTLGNMMMVHATKFFELSLRCLSSHLWIVRNAATHLLGAISSRMLGQKHIESTDHTSVTNSLTLQEFFSWYPELPHVMLSFFEDDCAKGKEVEKLYSSAIYPIISILSKLSNTQDVSENKNLQKLLDSLQQYMACPSFAVRKASAQAILGLHSVSDVASMACCFLQSLPPNHTEATILQIHQNKLHGWLELVYHLFQQHKDDIKFDHSLRAVCGQLLKRKWLANVMTNNCPLTAAHYIQTLRLLLQSLPDVCLGQEIVQPVMPIVLNLNKFNFKQAGAMFYLEQLIYLILDSSEMTKDVSVCEKILDLDYPFVHTVVVQCLQRITKPQSTILFQNHAHEILVMVWNQPLGTNDSYKLEFLAQMWPNIKANLTAQMYNTISTKLLQIHNGGKNLSTTCHLIPALSCLVEYDLSCEDNASSEMCHLQPWLDEVSKYTYSSMASEPLRFASATGLRKVGANILWWIHKHVTSASHSEELLKLIKVSATIYKTALYHLSDEQPEIREETCIFVSSLTKSVTAVSHHNISIIYLLGDLKQNIPAHYYIIEMLLEVLIDVPCMVTSDNRAGVSLFQQEAFNLFVEPCAIAKTLDPIVKKIIEDCPKLPVHWVKHCFNKGTKRLRQVTECTFKSGSKIWCENATCTVMYINNIVCAATTHGVPLSLTESNINVKLLQNDAKQDLAFHLLQYWKICKPFDCNHV